MSMGKKEIIKPDAKKEEQATSAAVGILNRRVAELEAQIEVPLTPHEVQMLHDVLAEQKAKLGERAIVLDGLALLEKFDGYLHPKLPLEKKPAEADEEKTKLEADV